MLMSLNYSPRGRERFVTNYYCSSSDLRKQLGHLTQSRRRQDYPRPQKTPISGVFMRLDHPSHVGETYMTQENQQLHFAGTPRHNNSSTSFMVELQRGRRIQCIDSAYGLSRAIYDRPQTSNQENPPIPY